MEKLYRLYQKHFCKWLVGGCTPDSLPLILIAGSASGLKLQKVSKESGIFQSLGTISFVLFY